jgi:hypothetical protein
MQNDYSGKKKLTLSRSFRQCTSRFRHAVTFSENRPRAVNLVFATSGTPLELPGHDRGDLAHARFAEFAAKR